MPEFIVVAENEADARMVCALADRVLLRIVLIGWMKLFCHIVVHGLLLKALISVHVGLRFLIYTKSTDCHAIVVT